MVYTAFYLHSNWMIDESLSVDPEFNALTQLKSSVVTERDDDDDSDDDDDYDDYGDGVFFGGAGGGVRGEPQTTTFPLSAPLRYRHLHHPN